VIARGDGRRLITNPALVVGLIGLAALLAMGMFGLMLAPHDPNAGANLFIRDLPNGNTEVRVPPTLPDADHLLGTDTLGRDQWSRVLAGARLTLAVVLGATVVRLLLGFTLGLIAGWYGGPLARGLRTVAAGVAAIPQLVLAIMLVLVLQSYREVGFIVALALVGWPELVEFLHSEVRRLRERPFIEAARAIGAPGRRLVTSHLVAALAPRLLTLTALETGAVLLLLAELGLVGLFLSGSTALIDDFGVIGTLKERAPEWGQMLGSIQFFAMQYQLSTLLPALFIVIASAVFAILADGLRAASDPFGSRGVLPGTFGVVAKGLAAAVTFSAVGFLALNIPSNAITLEEGRVIAANTAEKTWPGSQFVAAVARYSSQAHGLDRPQRVNYYFRNERNEVLRVEFKDGDKLSQDTRMYETEDEIDFTQLKPLPAGLLSWDGPIAQAESRQGRSFRQTNPNYLIRGILTWPAERESPVYEVVYGTNNRGQLALRRVCCYDGKTGDLVDSVVRPRVPAPYPVPSSCRPNAVVTQDQPGAPEVRAFYVMGRAGLSVGTIDSLYYQGDNFLLMLANSSGAAIPRLESAARADAATTAAAKLNDVFVGGYTPGGAQTVVFATLALPDPGCWTVTISAGTNVLEYTLYAYPWGCRSEEERAMGAPAGVTPVPCPKP
jgi:ABC-type dipeptide/oligopeptide/nickel transport system permease subunit